MGDAVKEVRTELKSDIVLLHEKQNTMSIQLSEFIGRMDGLLPHLATKEDLVEIKTKLNLHLEDHKKGNGIKLTKKQIAALISAATVLISSLSVLITKVAEALPSILN